MSNAKNSQSANQSNRADGDVKTTVTNAIVAMIEAGGLDGLRERWSKTGMGLPTNAKTKNPYTGINVLLLSMAAIAEGYSSNCWLTYKQAAEMGGQVRKGETSTLGVFFKQYERESAKNPEEMEKIAFAKALRLFNLDQIDGLPADVMPVIEQPKNIVQVFEDCEALLDASGAVIEYEGERAFYSPSIDKIRMPERGSFYGSEVLYSTAFHELAHWTGAKHRLDRDFSGRFGDEAYAMEELIAELAAAFICAHTSVKNACLQENASYVASWLRVLKNDKNAIFTASSAAWKAAEFLFSFQLQKEVESAEV